MQIKSDCVTVKVQDKVYNEGARQKARYIWRQMHKQAKQP